MANALYPNGKEGFLDGTIDWNTDTIEVLLCRGYTYDSTDEFEADLTGVTVVDRATLTTPTVTNGVADADDGAFGAVATGAACDVLILLANKGSAATNRLIAFIDTATNLPVTPNGGNISVAWDAGANKIFAL